MAGLDAFGLVVSDMAKSLAFYRQLGCDVPPDVDAETHVDIALGGGIRLMLDTVELVESIMPGWEPPRGGHRIGLAFRSDDPADVDARFHRLTAGGAVGVVEPYDAFWGQRYATVSDPDGNPVDLYAAL